MKNMIFKKKNKDLSKENIDNIEINKTVKNNKSNKIKEFFSKIFKKKKNNLSNESVENKENSNIVKNNKDNKIKDFFNKIFKKNNKDKKDIKKDNNSNIKEFFNKKIKGKKIDKKTIIIGIVILLAILVVIYILFIRIGKDDKNTASFDEIATMIEDKDTFLIYYYNSRSKNKNNEDTKKYLDELGIKYFNYNDVLVSRKEYKNFLKLVNIDKSVFGMPSLIYIRDGKMYANIINIDNKEVVKQFVDNYDLYTVK